MERHVTPRVVSCEIDSRTVKLSGSSHTASSPVLAKTIGCGAYHSMMVLIQSKIDGSDDVIASESIFTSGLNNYGQLGLGEDVGVQVNIAREITRIRHDSGNMTASPVEFDSRNASIQTVCGGVHHSCALLRGGSTGSSGGPEIYTWGRCDSGQLGIKSVSDKAGESVNVPTHMPLPLANSGSNGSVSDITQLTCGGNHNMCLVNTRNTADSTAATSTAPEVYSWGYGDMLALGHGKEKDEMVPKVSLVWNVLYGIRLDCLNHSFNAYS